jgi:hypothetical protein
MTARTDLLGSVAETIADYRAGEISRPTPAHVERWVKQFPSDVQLPLLGELSQVLKRTYITRHAMASAIGTILDEGLRLWEGASLLTIQQHGQSQADLLKLFGDETHQDDSWDVLVENVGTTGRYIYLDDVLFSGNRIGTDLGAWIRTNAPPIAEVHIVVYASHTLGEWQCIERLKDAAGEAGKEIRFWVWRAVSIENRKKFRDSSELLWPTDIPDNPAVRTYAALPHKFPVELRNPGGPLGPFSSEAGRQLLERELLVAGVKIRANHANPKDSMRPLGFSQYGLGFGSMIVTYRNCPNNTPLALWWGLGGWYPLFPRKGYNQEAEPEGLPLEWAKFPRVIASLDESDDLPF